MEVDNEVTRLRVLKSAFEGKRYLLQDAFTFQYPQRIAARKKELEKLEGDIRTRNEEVEKNPLFDLCLPFQLLFQQIFVLEFFFIFYFCIFHFRMVASDLLPDFLRLFIQPIYGILQTNIRRRGNFFGVL